ncbi:MAG: aconitate hydratase [Deltaproteobacteria bacterium]|nr:aconitate hydratase [Deltaproteobacteria bacterium]
MSGMIPIETTPQQVERAYATIRKNLEGVRKRFHRPFTLSEKILFGHLDHPETQELKGGESILSLRVDRVAMQDATAQMAILQFAQAKIPRVAVPTTVHCDHLIQAYVGSKKDTETALSANKEVYDFLSSASQKFGIGFWKPGSGIIHQVVLENYAFPGGLMIGTDSHTPNAGGLGMIAVGVGGADAVDAMAGLPWEVKQPKLIGVRLTGKLNGWAAPKDVILWVCEQLTVKGGTNHIVEYFGPGVPSISGTGKATICNMGAEHGATTSIFPYDERMATYLKATDRGAIAEVAEKNRDLLCVDSEVEKNPERFFDRILELDLSKLEPYVNGPHSPDRARPISRLKADVQKENYPDLLKAALIGSCTNSSYEDIARVVDVAAQAKKAGLQAPIPLLVSPGSEKIFETIQRDGFVKMLEEIGATVLANACGPCIGQWKRDDIKKGERNSILNSFNRNFPGRNDANPETLSFIASPEMVMALGLAGRLSFNPLTDSLKTSDGREIRLQPPAPAPEIPPKGFAKPMSGFVPPAEEGEKIQIQVSPSSERLQLLEPFPAWDGSDFIECPLLLKARGKCTTDHISPAGPWLRYRGHLDKISDNMLTGAVNAFTGTAGKTRNLLTGAKEQPVPQVARSYKGVGRRWIVVGDDNYGEGSSREHAAMSPRYLGCAAVITKSFARIHETNLKKQGILPLTFSNASDYDKVQETDKISIVGLSALQSGKPMRAVLHHADGKTEELTLNHSLTPEQIRWFHAGSALNLLRS